ncbi:MAG: exosome complex protein Rrp4 [Nanoarchaeota archaeon]|nr:exosome complex protein Rrp4 [Nanoarchaeota archaeon]MBU1135547.1 exosome complex protein Rrp4 [Nanoarchaeota archaeon]MBU2520388.1 exosome complex protein Rrp4 [Nanoarchaeota archaeon]
MTENVLKTDNSQTKMLKNDKDFVVPGDEIVKSMEYLPGRNCFREGDSLISKRLGLVNINNRVISVIPLSGVYLPKVGDMVIGEVKDVQSNGWIINMHAPYMAFLPLSGIKEFVDTSKTSLSKIFGVGDFLYAKISGASGDSLQVSMQDNMCRKFRSGQIVKIISVKVPRVIGKQGSMINLIKDKTGCRINVGQNGFIWIEGEKEELAKNAIKLVEQESHTDGLTDKISALLENKGGKK